MWNRRLVVAVLPLLLLTCLERQADADPIGGGIVRGLPGLLMIALAAIVLLEGIVCLVEGIAYAAFGGLTWGRALGTSLLANLASFVVGVFALWHATSTWSQALVGLLVCLAVEIPIVLAVNWSHVSSPTLRSGPDGHTVARAPTLRWTPAAKRLLVTVVAANTATWLALVYLVAMR